MKLDNDYPTVLFSIETTTRELDSKLVMASALAAQGCRVIVGHKEDLVAIGRSSTHALWQGRSLFSRTSSSHLAESLIERNSAIMYLHDEGGMYQVKWWVQNLLWRHDIDQLGKVNRICVWGETQKNIISDYEEALKNRIAVTGSPRFDLCRSLFSWLTRTTSEEIRFKYSPFILVCTRFSIAASATGASLFEERFDLSSMRRPGVASVDSGITEWDATFSEWQAEVHDFADFVVLTKEIALNYPRYTVILRPHPSENLAFYETVFASIKNVVVTRQRSVVAWVRAAELVVHSNCTTGVEAVLAERPVLNFLPGRDSEYDIEIAREAGTIARSIGDALTKIEELLSSGSHAQVWSSHAQAMLYNLNHQTIPALVTETMGVLQETKVTSSKIEVPDEVKRPKRDYVRSKRSLLDPDHIGMVLAGCQSHHIGGGRVSHLTPEYVVVDPA